MSPEIKNISFAQVRGRLQKPGHRNFVSSTQTGPGYEQDHPTGFETHSGLLGDQTVPPSRARDKQPVCSADFESSWHNFLQSWTGPETVDLRPGNIQTEHNHGGDQQATFLLIWVVK
jgi:hypothetical protein